MKGESVTIKSAGEIAVQVNWVYREGHKESAFFDFCRKFG